jgi:hypothetical protein
MMSETEAFYPAKPSDRDKGGFDLREERLADLFDGAIIDKSGR